MDNHFSNYLQKYDSFNLHSKMEKRINQLSNVINNIILYGSDGIGKYTQALNIIRKHSPTELKYEKKLIHQYNKQEFKFKLSDVHLEVDMNLLGCNAKVIWTELFSVYTDIIATKVNKVGII